MPQYPIGQSPVRLTQAVAQAFTIRNNGPDTVFIGSDPSLSYLTGTALVLGASSSRAENTELWVCTAPGDSATVELIYGAGSSFTDGTQQVQISGDVNLAPGSQVGIDGLVQVAGSIDVTGGSINVSSITGDVSVDGSVVDIGSSVRLGAIPVLLSQATLTLPAGTGGFILPAQGNVDVSPYNSILVIIDQTSPVGTPIETAYMQLAIIQSEISGAHQTRDQAEYLIGTSLSGSSQSLQVPVKNSVANIVVGGTRPTTSYAGSVISYRLYGSGETLSRNRYIHNISGALGNMPDGGMARAAISTAPTTLTQFLNTINTPLAYYMYKDQSVSAWVLNIQAAQQGAIQSLATVVLQTGGANFVSATGTQLMPQLPIRINLQASAAASANNFAALQQS